MPVDIITGNQYFALLSCRVTRKVWAKAFPEKLSVPIADWVEEVLSEEGVEGCSLQIDNGTEFNNGALQAVLAINEGEITNIPAYEPNMNGGVEQMNNTVKHKMNTMLHDFYHDLSRKAEGVHWETFLYTSVANVNNRQLPCGCSSQLLASGEEDAAFGLPPFLKLAVRDFDVPSPESVVRRQEKAYASMSAVADRTLRTHPPEVFGEGQRVSVRYAGVAMKPLLRGKRVAAPSVGRVVKHFRASHSSSVNVQWENSTPGREEGVTSRVASRYVRKSRTGCDMVASLQQRKIVPLDILDKHPLDSLMNDRIATAVEEQAPGLIGQVLAHIREDVCAETEPEDVGTESKPTESEPEDVGTESEPTESEPEDVGTGAEVPSPLRV